MTSMDDDYRSLRELAERLRKLVRANTLTFHEASKHGLIEAADALDATLDRIEAVERERDEEFGELLLKLSSGLTLNVNASGAPDWSRARNDGIKWAIRQIHAALQKDAQASGHQDNPSLLNTGDHL